MLKQLTPKLHSLSFTTKRLLTMILVIIGLATLIYYATWWLEPNRANSILYAPLLTFAVIYSSVQILSAWFIYINVKLPAPKKAPPGLTVDVFVPVYDEAYSLIATSLKAAVKITYPHKTYLLDDSHNDKLRELAESLGAIYLRRQDRQHAKAGNVNHALSYSTAEFVTVFDVDHIPEPHFLDVVLGHFADPQIGFVQAFVAYSNQAESFIARATADQSYDIFSATSMGMHGCNSAVVWGAHCTFRRKALDSIGGHKIGLAEDLYTSISLHASGWKSIYVPQVVARGLVPADLRAYFVQQLKWSRGVFEVLLEKSLPQFFRLSLSQIICYLTRMSYYLVGLVTLINLVAIGTVLWFGEEISRYHFASYLLHFLPGAMMVLFIRLLMSILWEQDPKASLNHFAGTSLTIGSWHVYVFSLVCAILRIRLPHIATPKQKQGGWFIGLILPPLVLLSLLLGGVIWRLIHSVNFDTLIIGGFALVLIFMHWAVFYGVWEGWQTRRARSIASYAQIEPFLGAQPCAPTDQ
jgi:cellulose synthase (UDP-forming)